jgi:hypothetical protein
MAAADASLDAQQPAALILHSQFGGTKLAVLDAERTFSLNGLFPLA